MRTAVALGLAALASLAAVFDPARPVEPGLVVAVGGGGTPREAVREVIKLAGGAKARVLVLPQASNVNDGQGDAEMWREEGAGEASVLSDLGADDAVERIHAADVIWMPGGSQLRLMERLREHSIDDAIRLAHSQGKIVGGTSAGAAVLSKVMISGPPEPRALVHGAMEAHEGLGLWPGAIVDQHFVERERQGRLLTAVLDHPELVGYGISERTAALVFADRIEVLGEGQVLVYDAREAEVGERDEAVGRQLQHARGVKLDVLQPR